MEQALGHEPLAKKEGEGLDKKCNISVLSRTKRLADPDGRSIKALIDGLVEAGVLEDDSAKFINQTSQSQEITDGEEETIVYITWN